ncbi:Phosphatidate cytidylyltransferase [uncultured Paludibacter sp.]|nr:Phosphatidate cytidylyltransferase [uncultured Paludibacter sp.]
MKNLALRLVSGVIFVVLLVGSILISPYTFAVLFAAIMALAIREFHQLTNKNPDIQVNTLIAVIGGVLLFIGAFVSASKLTDFPVYTIYGVYVIVILISELFRKKQNPIHNWAYFVLGQIYTALPFALLNYILYVNNYQPIILLAVFISIWVNDTGAYCTGMLLGKHKLFKRISPKKTWEGFLGGAVFVLISGYIFSRFIPELTLLQWFIFSEIVVIFGTLGDLSESLIKRTLDVKDSGNAIPGHGGILDRFDSMIMAAPMVFLLLSLILK